MEQRSNKHSMLCAGIMTIFFFLGHPAHAGTANEGPPCGSERYQSTPAPESARTPARDETTAAALGNLVGTIAVPEKASRMLNGVYERNKDEIYRILNENPYILWKTIGLVAGALPALTLITEQGGRLYLDRQTYSKANSLYEEYRELASPRFTAELDQTKSYIDQRTEETGSGDVVIDLNK